MSSVGVKLDENLMVKDEPSSGYVNYGDKVEYECKPGYRLVGSKVRKCTQNENHTAKWSCEEPRCEGKICSLMVKFVLLDIFQYRLKVC